MTSQQDHKRHVPLHIFVPNTIYMVTASTLYKQHLFRGNDRLQLLCDVLLEVTTAYEWSLQAWSVFSNHYHFIAQSSDQATTLRNLIQRLHSQTAREINKIDQIAGRQVWFQYWDTCLTFEKSYYARLNYVHNNPVKHNLVAEAIDYPFCSAAWFEANADLSLHCKVQSAPHGEVSIDDSFVPMG